MLDVSNSIYHLQIFILIINYSFLVYAYYFNPFKMSPCTISNLFKSESENKKILMHEKLI